MARGRHQSGGVTQSACYMLAGAGGHARAVLEAIEDAGGRVATYLAPEPSSWLMARHVVSDDAAEPTDGLLALGIGGATPEAHKTRLAMLDDLLGRGFEAPPVIHAAAHVSGSADLGAASAVLAGAVVQPAVEIGRGAIVNSGAIVEHDSMIGAGSHVAPGAIILGDCTIGETCMIGAGSVVLPGSSVPDGALVPALTRFGQER